MDSGRGSDTEASEGWGEGLVALTCGAGLDHTSVALAWLEHRCARAFGEWELAAEG